MTTQDIIQYYANLLILQYVGQPKAVKTIRALVAPVVMDQLPLQVQNAFCIGDQTINGITYPGAVGVQLDILGKYVGVMRTGYDLTHNPVTLNDSDFTQLIKIAIITNNSGSSLYSIQTLLQQYFANEIFVYDGADMQLSYLVTSSVGSKALVELFITEGLLPKPMGVQLASIVYVPVISLYGYLSYSGIPAAWNPGVTYAAGAQVFQGSIVYSSLVAGNLNNAVTDVTKWEPIIYPLNSYVTYPTYEPYTWLSYADSIVVV